VTDIPASLARIEAKLEAIEDRLTEGAAEFRDYRHTKTKVATLQQSVQAHSRVFWGLGAALFALIAEKVKGMF
jgi:hypothetical protein